MIEDNRSKRFVLIPFCLTCQAFQAQGIVKYEWRASIKPVVQKLIDNDINIVQMPCPESSYEDYSKSLVREPMGLKGYDNEEYREHCKKICIQVFNMIKPIVDNGYTILAILGIENSPSCAVSYIYSNKGMQSRMGVFLNILNEILKDHNLEIPFIGINRKSVRKSLEKLDEILSETSDDV